jgi:hypothetical protein
MRPGRRPWSSEDKEFLAENLGRIPKEQIAKRLNRSENALKIAAYRKLNGLSQRSNIITARDLARELGVGCPKTLVRWMEAGFLKGKHAPFYYGKTPCWSFEYEDIITCLRERPWLVDLKKMEISYFRTVVREEYERDPWYGTREAAPFLGLVDINAVHRYIRHGWLPAVRRPLVGGKRHGSWGWVIRRSDIDAMLKNDPRPTRRRYALIKSRRRAWLDEGRPVPVLKEWLIRCPLCRHKVRIIAEPNLRSPHIKELFVKKYATNQCTHGHKVLIDGR